MRATIAAIGAIVLMAGCVSEELEREYRASLDRLERAERARDETAEELDALQLRLREMEAAVGPQGPGVEDLREEVASLASALERAREEARAAREEAGRLTAEVAQSTGAAVGSGLAEAGGYLLSILGLGIPILGSGLGRRE